ncbi:MAG: DNA methyltransferase, partial [Bacteroidota bacterium]
MMTQTEPNLDKAFDLLNLELKIFKPHASDFEKFCKALNDYLKKLPALEHDQEKPIEQVFTRFLQDAFTEYTDKYVVRSVEDIDLTICVKSAKRPSVLIECKKPSETKDFPRNSHLNVKALHQLIYYYLKETIEHHNTGIKSLIITNGKELYIFDEATFNRCFGEKYNKILKQEYNHNKVGKRGTDEFYTVMKRYLEENPEILEKLTLLHFSIESLSQELQKPEPLKSRRLQKAYKALCKFSLLKEALPNTGNTLNQAFYDELLHIIGLEEVKADGKKLIQRKQNTPESASLIESILSQNKASFAQHTTPQNRDDKVIELVITWVNRILFLKLLEAQLVRYHKGNQTFKFMGEKYLTDWDHVNQLFFDVLAIKEQERHPNKRVQDLHFVPYLNSSLFERSELEQQLGTINNLTENELGLHPKTVLKHHVKRRTGTMRNIDYLLSFLDAYDFGSDTEDDGVQHNDKTLINASVLGLVFEKINGYKEGSFYTPSVITMYMCKESLRLAVIQKLNEAFDWQHSEWQDLKMACVNLRTEEKIKASNVINQLKICDPAVGSGHFLVSALNELLAIKADLELLVKDGIVRRLDIRIVNDELVIQDDNDEAPFQYHVSLDGLTQKRSVAKRKQTIQELLFDEKRTLIEQCLFGVDINPNSVQICRLRLWIELLKNTYYKSETAYKELETLPNIDINIKCGNSLISKFGIREKISLSVKDASHVKDLQTLSKSYHHAKEKSFKADITHRIQEIKASFKNKCIEGTTEYVDRTKLRKKLEGLEHKVIELTGILKDEYRLGFFPDDEIDNMKRELVKKRLDLTKQKNALKKADARVEESIKTAMYH